MSAPASPATVPSRPASLDAVLDYAWGAAEFTATTAMAFTGMTRSTVIEALDTLAGLGILSELPDARQAGDYRKGRPARRFSLRSEAAVLVGVDAGQAHLTVHVTDLRSRLLASYELTLDSEQDTATARSRLILAAIDTALGRVGLTRAAVLSICVGVPAPVDGEGRSPRHRNGFWARMNPDLIDSLAWAPLSGVENDASLAAVAEGAVGVAVGCRNYIALLAGGRLGAGVVVDGNLLRGAHGGVGEMVAFDHVRGVESAEGLGSRAAHWAAAAIAKGEVASAGALAAIPPERIDGRTVLELATAGDVDAKAIVVRVGEVLGRIIGVLGSMFDPQRVIVSGAIAAGADSVVEAARESLPTGLDLPAPDLVISGLGGDVVVIGAVAAAAKTARERILDVWPRPGG